MQARLSAVSRVVVALIAVWTFCVGARAQDTRLPFEAVMRQIQARYQYTHPNPLGGFFSYQWPGCCYGTGGPSAPAYPPNGFYGEHIGPGCARKLTSYIVDALIETVEATESTAPYCRYFLKEAYWNLEGTLLDPSDCDSRLDAEDLRFHSWTTVHTYNYAQMFALAEEGVKRLKCVVVPLSLEDNLGRGGDGVATGLENFDNCGDALDNARGDAVEDWEENETWTVMAANGIFKYECAGAKEDTDPDPDVATAAVQIGNSRAKIRMNLSGQPTSLVSGDGQIFLTVGTPPDGPSNEPPVLHDGLWHAFEGSSIPTNYLTDFVGDSDERTEPSIPCGDALQCEDETPLPCCIQRGWSVTGQAAILTLTFIEDTGEGVCTFTPPLPPWREVETPDTESDLSSEETTCGKGGGGGGPGGGGPKFPSPNGKNNSEPGGRNGKGAAATGRDPEWGNPVQLATGAKIERETDMTVALPGSTFVVNRGYCSNPTLGEGNGICGARWSMSIFTRLQVGESSIRLVGSTLQSAVVLIPQTGGGWKANGPSRQTLVEATTTINGTPINVYRLEEPGAWRMDFYRTTDHRNGLLLQEVDVYDNLQTYAYKDFDELNNSPHETTRLESIFLNGEDEDDCDAQIMVDWYLPALEEEEEEVPESTLGKVHSIHAYRYNAARERSLLMSVFYRYKEEDDGFSDYVGTDGDLIEVISRERVDQSPELPFRTRITQYRYHNGETPDTENPRIDITGGLHQLKHVIRPEQIEYLAQKTCSPTYTPDGVEAAATDLMGRDDTWVYSSAGINVIDLPAKIVGYTSNKVSVQYIQTACGCSGAGSQGTKEEFTYYATGLYATVKVVESVLVSSTFQAYRNHYCDMKYLGGVPYLVTYAIQDPAATTKIWAWHYVYDESTTRTLQRMMYPSALDPTTGYTAATSIAAATYVSLTSAGLVYGWTYSPDYQVVETRLDEGSAFTSSKLLSKTTFPPSNGADCRTWLPSKVELYTSDTATTDDLVEKTIYTYGFHSGHKISWVRTQVEAELKEENGPDSAITYDNHELFDTTGQNTWSRSAGNVLTKREFDAYSGAITSITRNANNSTLGTWTGLTVTSWGRESEGGALTTTFTNDKLGRVTSRTSPGNVTSYTLRVLRVDSERPGVSYYSVISLPHRLSGAGDLDGPISIGWFNASGAGTRSSDYTNGGAFYDPLALNFTLGDEIARSTTQHHLSGLVESRKAWHNVAAPTTDYYINRYEYDALGRLSVAKSPVKGSDPPTLTRNSYDLLNRVIKVEVGTDLDAMTGDMLPVAEYFYDGGGSAAQGVGDGHLTYLRQHTGEPSSGGLATQYRDTKRTYDYRGRVQVIERPSAPHEYLVHDNLDRVIKRGLYSTVPGGIGSSSDTTRGLYVESYFSQRGLPYKQRVAINAADISNTTPNDNGFLETNTWYDMSGRVVAEWAPNAPGTKRQYDAHGRTTLVYVTDRGGDDAPGSTGNYAAVITNDNLPVISGDTIIEQTEYTYGLPSDPWPDRLMLVKTLRRNHDAATGSGSSLGTTTSVASYVGYFYDSALRRTHTIDFGTNDTTTNVFTNASAPTWPPSPLAPPAFNANPIVSAVEFNARGLVARSIDPKQRATEYRYDDLSRRIAVIENAQGATGSLSISWDSGLWEVTGLDPGTNFDQDRVTSFVYDASGNVTKQIAHTSDTTHQVTAYTYSTDEDTPGTDTHSLIGTRGALLSKVAYPNESTGLPGTTGYEVTYAYNRLGELRSVVDQNDTKHTYNRDGSGRVQWDTPTLGSGSTIDNAIKRIAVSYDPFGRLDTVKSYSSLSGDGTIRNEVEFVYTKLWQVAKVYQNVSGAVDYNTGTGVPVVPTVVVGYGYGTIAAPTSGSAASNFSRVTSMTYPDGNSINYGYGTAAGLDDRISRAHSIADPADSYPIVAYDRVGLDLFAIVDYPLADVQLDRSFSRDGKRRRWTTQTESRYPGWDRHGRVAIHAWMDGVLDEGPTVPTIVDEGYTYDKASNREQKYDMRPGVPASINPDWQYTYDGLDRLIEAKKNVRTATPFTALVGSQKWTLDVLGNWTKVQKELGGSTLYGDAGETEDRTHNAANEITNRYPNGSSNSPTLPFTYDAAGNLRDQNYSTSGYQRFTHDAWNRMVSCQLAGTPLPQQPVQLENEYNGLHWRTISRVPADSMSEEPGGTIREMYYSAAWQLIEERVDEDYVLNPGTNRTAQEVWGLRYIDDAVMRTAEVGAEDPRRFYHLTDVQFSTVAMVGMGGKYAPVYERVSYDPYGKATHRWAGDVNNDGAVNSTDVGLVTTAAAANSGAGYTMGVHTAYDVRMDLNRDGLVNDDDEDLFVALPAQSALGSGEISDRSSEGPDNLFGYDGYVFAPELARYCVRFRWYDPVTGRWMERDPAGYVDGMLLFQFGRSAPNLWLDPYGLDPDDTRTIVIRINNDAPQSFKRNKSAIIQKMQKMLDSCGFCAEVQVAVIMQDPGTDPTDLGVEKNRPSLTRQMPWWGVIADIPTFFVRTGQAIVHDITQPRYVVSYTHHIQWDYSSFRAGVNIVASTGTTSTTMHVTNIEAGQTGATYADVYANVLLHEVLRHGLVGDDHDLVEKAGGVDDIWVTHGVTNKAGKLYPKACEAIRKALGIPEK
jgi:RHS repeat-associated protein